MYSAHVDFSLLTTSIFTTDIASAVDLGHTFNDAAPNVERSRDELLAQISRYRLDKKASHTTNDEDYVLLYAYSKSLTKAFPRPA